jgi:hypothetical protein
MIRIAGAPSVRSSHRWSVDAARFDERSLVSCAGLVPVWSLAEQTGLPRLLEPIFYMLQRDQPYHDLGVDYFIRRDDPERRARKLIRQLEAIGYSVQAEPPPPAAA